jgi:hypothetical protein
LLRKLKREVFWETISVSGNLLVQTPSGDSVERGQVGIEQSPLAAKYVDGLLNLGGSCDSSVALRICLDSEDTSPHSQLKAFAGGKARLVNCGSRDAGCAGGGSATQLPWCNRRGSPNIRRAFFARLRPGSKRPGSLVPPTGSLLVMEDER